jgi:two-component system LytT family response regulator
MENRKFRSVIIEDELPSRESLKKLLHTFCPQIDIVGEAGNIRDAISLIQTVKPKLVFSDIMLEDGDAFQVLNRLEAHDFDIIFTTAHDEYAIKAFKFNALDYLLKPIDTTELVQAVEKVWTRTILRPRITPLLENLRMTKNENPVITLSTSDSFEYIHVRDIIRCKADGAYTTFYISGREPVMVSKTLKEFDLLLTPFQFFRVHQSHLINVKEVNRYLKLDGGSVVLHDGSQVPVSRSKKDEFLQLMSSPE